MSKQKGDIHIHINVNGVAVNPGPNAPNVSVTITYPTASDTPPPSFKATGTVDPAFAALLGVVFLKGDASKPLLGKVVSGGPDWVIQFTDLPAGVPLILYVYASDGKSIGYSSVEFTCAKKAPAPGSSA
jgi:hypothetical protein